jgi:hypothetical protein
MRAGYRPASALDESKQVRIDHVSMRGHHSVREAGINLQRAIFEQLGLEQRSVGVRYDLVLIAGLFFVILPLRISFPSLEVMHRVLTPNRWDILRTRMASGPLGTRELARKLDRDVKSVHMDVQALLNAGVIDRTAECDKIEFPYDAVHVDFTVEAA